MTATVVTDTKDVLAPVATKQPEPEPKAKTERKPSPQPPADELFDASGFLERADLTALMEFIRTYKTIGLAPAVRVAVLWKRKGGKVRSKTSLSTSGLLGWFAPVDAVIWLAADKCRDGACTPNQIEALLYHELSHIATDEKGNYTIAEHDFAGFLAELKLYGCWQDELGAAKAAFEQAKLW